MKIELTQSELKNLKQEEDGTWSYFVVTINGKLKGEGFPNPEEAVKHAQRELVRIVKAIVRRKK